MTIRDIGLGTLASKRSILAATNARPTAPWVRNPSWLSLPDITGLQKFVGLFAVYDHGSNFVALTATVSSGNFTVDWGDGSAASNVASTVTAEKNIAYADAANTSDVGIASAVACTFTDSGDTVGLTAHGWQNGQRVAFSTITSTTGISTYSTYFVVNKATDTFQLASTPGGSALPLTTDGTGSVYVPQYRQVIISIVPQTANLTGVNLQKKHSQSSLSTHSAPWLDIALSGANVTSWTVGAGSLTIRLDDLEQAQFVGTNAITNASSMFYGCSSLASVPLFNLASVTNASSMFANCYSLVSVPLFNLASVTNASSMFSGCSSLASVPLFNLAAVTNASYMFYGCYSLASVPLFNLAAVTNASYMFQTCYSLVSVPLFNLASVTNTANMFRSCTSLVSVPLFNLAAVTDASNMFYGCYSLASVPLFNLASVTNASSMFYGCSSLASVPLFNLAAVTSASYMFSGCYSLVSVPLFNLAAVTNAGNMFQTCYSLVSVPLFNLASVTNTASMFYNCYSLVSVPLFNLAAVTDASSMFNGCVSLASARTSGLTATVSFSGCKMSSAELDAIYTGLGTVSSKTITVSNNWGTASDNPSIATAKGWTVTG